MFGKIQMQCFRRLVRLYFGRPALQVSFSSRVCVWSTERVSVWRNAPVSEKETVFLLWNVAKLEEGLVPPRSFPKYNDT